MSPLLLPANSKTEIAAGLEPEWPLAGNLTLSRGDFLLHVLVSLAII
jgi:hypothetical protein